MVKEGKLLARVEGKTRSMKRVVEPGELEIMVGTRSDALQSLTLTVSE
jgi:hypothetical protein